MAAGRRSGVKSWFVEPYKQVKLGLMFLVVNFAFAIAIVSVFGYFVYDMYASVVTYFSLTGAEDQITLQKFYMPLAIGASLMLLFIATTILVSVRYTHGIYGPLVSINRYLDDVNDGRTPKPISLRDSDQLKDLAAKLNSLAERFVDEKRAGVLIAVHRCLDDLIAGKETRPITLRDGDHFSELVTKVNELCKRASKA